jgi:LysM repeat protein
MHSIFSQNLTREEYVVRYYQLAIKEMNLYKIPASITLAQGILETAGGQSRLAKEANNHFGIKCQKTWTGPTISHDDDAKGECFRVYNSVEESYRDHSLFLATRDRYKKLFLYDIRDYKSWAYGLKEFGYATNPKYPQMLIKHIEELRLYEYDNYGSGSFEIDDATARSLSSKDSLGAIIKIVNSRKLIVKDSVKKDTTKLVIEKIQERKAPTSDDISNNLKKVILLDSISLYDIAKKNNLTIRELLIFNECEGEQELKSAQNIFLQRKLNRSFIALHEAKPGESIYDISQIYGVRMEAIRKFNKLEIWEQPQVGEAVFLNSIRNSYMKTRTYYDLQKERLQIAIEENSKNQKAFVRPVQNVLKKYEKDSIIDNQAVYHIVKSKETVFSISKKYGVSPSQLDKWNQLEDKPIQIGQKLVIYIE